MDRANILDQIQYGPGPFIGPSLESWKSWKNLNTTSYRISWFDSMVVCTSVAKTHGRSVWERESAMSGAASYLARRAAQKERVRILYRRALKDTLTWAVHRHLFYPDVFLSLNLLGFYHFRFIRSSYCLCLWFGFYCKYFRPMRFVRDLMLTRMWFVSLDFCYTLKISLFLFVLEWSIFQMMVLIKP